MKYVHHQTILQKKTFGSLKFIQYYSEDYETQIDALQYTKLGA